MRNLKSILIIVASIAFGIVGCKKEDLDKSFSNQESTKINSNELAVTLVEFLNEGQNLDKVVDLLAANSDGVPLEDILCNTELKSATKSADGLAGYVAASKQINLKAAETGVVQTPEIWLFRPSQSYAITDVLVSFVPEGDERDWESILAYSLNGEVVHLDPVVLPEVPVIVVDLDAMESLKLQVDLMNQELQKVGLQELLAKTVSNCKSASAGLQTTRLTKIRLNQDEESWIKGKAEIFAITSGIRGNDNNKEVEIEVVAMPYLDYGNTDYYPNQIMLFWDNYAYKAANIQLFDKDSNYSYKELVAVLVAGVFDITGVLTAQPWVVALGQVAGAIVEVMPSAWYTDDDDYVDSFYTIEKNKTYNNLMGARGNAKVSLKPFRVAVN